jgi:SAM-dependent methyltransferase
MECRACGRRTSVWKDRGDVALFRCGLCGFISGQPSRPELIEEYYHDHYSTVPPAAPDERYHEWLAHAEREVGRGRLLEVGAGGGGFVRAALARGWVVEATEVSASAIDTLRRTGATVFSGDVTAARYPDNRFDLVVSLEVVEHLAAPLAHLRELGRITRCGGLLLLTTPNFNGLSRRLLGIRWRVISPEHLGYFTLATLSGLVREAGYRTACVSARSLDVLSWRRGTGPAGARPFDPEMSARVRDAVESHWALRAGKAAVNRILRLTDLGDSLLVWAVR